MFHIPGAGREGMGFNSDMRNRLVLLIVVICTSLYGQFSGRLAGTVLDATVIVQSGKGHGSGFFLNPSGLVLTAAHVLSSSEVSVKTRDGVAYRARPLRVSRKFDVALLTGST